MRFREALTSPLLKNFYVAVLLLLLFSGTIASGREARLQRLLVSDPASIYLIPSPALTRVLAAGYTEAASDLAWVRTLIYFGEQAGIRGKFEHLHDHIDLVLALNPRFQRAYLWAGIVSIYGRSRITKESVENAIMYLKRGVEVFPDDGEMHYMLGFDLYFELPSFLRDDKGISEEEIRRVKLEGIKHFKAAILSGTRPEWLAGLVSTLLTRNGMVDLAIQSIEENLKYIEDPEAQKKLLARLQQLKGEREMSEYEKEVVGLQQRWAKDFPYLPLNMYLLVEPRSLSEIPVFAALPSERDSAMDILDQLARTR